MKSAVLNNFNSLIILILFGIFSSVLAQWEKNIIDPNLTNATVLYAADIDGDGDLDVAETSWTNGDVVWYENNGNSLNWTKHTIDANLPDVVGVFVADINSDTKMDVIAAGYQGDDVVWYENEGGSPIAWSKHIIDGNLDGANIVYVVDIDGDIDLDVVATGNLADDVVWYENEGGSPIAWSKHIIDESLDDVRQIRTGDIDIDGDLDVVAAGFGTDDIVWYENILPEQYWSKHTIDGNLDGAIGMSVADVDGDNDLDVAATGENDNDVVWYENNYPDTIWNKHIIDGNLKQTRGLDFADIDGDNLLDAVATSSGDNDVVWYKNNYPDSNWTKNVIDHNLGGARMLFLADLDEDTFTDVIANGQTANDVVWYKNPFSSQIIESSFEFEGLTREYTTVLPTNHQPNMPVVFCLHGHGDSVDLMINWASIHEVGIDSGFITVYPAALNKEWNTGNVPTATADDVGFISALIDTLSAKYNIDLSRIYSSGFGQGGAMSYKIAGELSNRITATASVAGAMCEAMLLTSSPQRDVPVVHFHGTDDTYEPWEGTDDPLYLLSVDATITHWTSKNNCSPFFTSVTLPDLDPNDGCTVEKKSYRNDEGVQTVILYKVNNGGHNWPGASVNYNWEGNKTNDIDANIEIWNFFKNFSHTPFTDSKIVKDNIEFEGLTRNYIVFLPKDLHSDMPLVINLHGSLPDDAEWMMGYTKMNDIADTAGFIVVYPNSLSPRWNANAGIPNIAESNANDVGFISALMDTLIVKYKIDTTQIYCCGLNYGGWMASELFCQIGHRFAAGARVNTSLGINQAERSVLDHPFPIVLFNGTADSYLPWPDGKEGVMGGEEAISWWVEHNNCLIPGDTVSLPNIDLIDNCTVEKINYTDNLGETKVVFYKVLNGGLSWPGAVGNETWDKPRNNDINAGVEIWNFFKDYEKSQDTIITETWSRKADMQTARKSHSSCVLDEKIYVFAGKGSTATLNSVEVYDPVQNSWTQMANMNSGRVVFSTCVYNGKIIAIGGSETMNGSPITSIEVYDPITNVWINKTEMPEGRIGATATIIGDKIYIIGGINSSKTTLIQQIDVFDMVSGEWTVNASIPTPRMNLSSVSFNGMIYTIGGTLGSENGYLGLDKVEVYNPVTDTWSDAATMITKRKNFATCEFDGNIYVFGGSNLDCGGILSSVEAYDPILNIWIEKSIMPSVLGGPSAVQFDNKIYISGGSTTACPATPQSTIYEFSDPLTSISQDSKEIGIPKNYVLYQNYPNPFNPTTTIKYTIPSEVKNQKSKMKNVTLKIYDILGSERITLVNNKQKSGNYAVKWDASDYPSGIYFYRLQAGEFSETKKMIFIK